MRVLLSNPSSELAGLGYSVPMVVLHWILSPELLPLAGGDTPVCGADRAWRFRCVPPCLLGASTCDSADFPSDDCALFCTLLGEVNDNGDSFAPFRVLWRGRKRVHVFPGSKATPLRLASCV